MYTTRRRITAVFLLIYCLLWVRPGLAITGNEWLNITEDAQHLYVVGALSGWKTAELMCKQTKDNCVFIHTFVYAISCLETAPFSQYVDIVRNYVKDHPDRWNDDMALTTWMAVGESCKTGR
jgi:hypothetical protein